jgi:hypothetical protein
MSNIYSNQVGADLNFILNVDLTGISLVEIEITKPDATSWLLSTASGLTITDLLTGTLSYTTVTGDLNIAGTYFCNFFITDAGTRLYSGNSTLSIYKLTDTIIIHERWLDQIKKCIAYPDVDNLLLDDTQIKNFCVFPALHTYFNKFPILSEQTQSINGEVFISFPDDETFGIIDARIVDVGLVGGTGTGFWDIVAFNTYSSPYITSKSTGAYGKKGYNPSGLIYQKDIQRQTLKSQQNMYTTLKTRVDHANKRLIAYSSISGTLNITWAKYSSDFDKVKNEYKLDVVKLAQAELMIHLANSSAILVDSGLEVSINTDYLKSSASELFTEVKEKWDQIPDMILLHMV